MLQNYICMYFALIERVLLLGFVCVCMGVCVCARVCVYIWVSPGARRTARHLLRDPALNYLPPTLRHLPGVSESFRYTVMKGVWLRNSRAKRVSVNGASSAASSEKWAGRVFGDSFPWNHLNSLKINFFPLSLQTERLLPSKTMFRMKPHVSAISQLISDDPEEPFPPLLWHISNFCILIPKKRSLCLSVSATVPTLKCVWKKQRGAAAQRERLAQGTGH